MLHTDLTLSEGDISKFHTWTYELVKLRPGLNFTVDVFCRNEVGEGPAEQIKVRTTVQPSSASFLCHKRDGKKLRTSWRFNDPTGIDGQVLHCFAVVVPSTSDIDIKLIYASRKNR